MAWAALGKAALGAVKGGAKKIAADKLLNRKKNVKNRRAKAQEAMGGGGEEQERGGPLAIRPTTSLVPYSAGALAKVDDGGGKDGGDGATPKELVLSINKKFIKVERLLKGSVSIKENAREDARKAKEIASDKAQEKALEKQKPKDGYMKLPGAKAAQSLLGKMFNFIGTILLGWVLVRWEKWLPKLLKVAKWLAIGADWILDKAGKILNVLAGVIDAGYKFIDKLKGWVSNIYGEEGLKKFTTFLGNLKDLVTGFMLWKMFGEKIFKAMVEGIKFLWKAVTQGIRRAWTGLRRLIGRKARIFFKNIASKIGGAARSGMQWAGNIAQKGISKVGSFLSKGGSKLASTGAGKVVGKVGGWAGNLFGKAAKFIAPALKGAMPAIKGFAKRIPIFGSLIVALVSLMSGEPLGQALFKGVGAALGGALGTFIPIPFLGTLLGETFGMFIGDALYYGIVEKDWKKAGKVLKQHLMGVLKAGKAVKDWIGGGISKFTENLFKTDPIEITEGWGRRAAATKIAEVLGMKKWLSGLGYVENDQVVKFPNLLNLLNPFKFYPLLFKSFFGGKEKGSSAKGGSPASGGEKETKPLKAAGQGEKSKVSDEGLKTYASYETMGADTVKIASTSKPAEESGGGSGTVKFVPVPTGSGSDSYEVLDAFG